MLNEESPESPESKSEDTEIGSFLKNLERERQRDKKRPEIAHLEDAIESINGLITFKLDVGQHLLIERYTDFNGTKRWFDTRTYEIKAINADTGAVRLYDHENKQYASTNFKVGPSNALYKFKIPNKNKLKSRVKWLKDEQKTREAPPKKQKDGLRMVYISKNVIHTRIAGIPYGPTGDTQAKPGDRLKMTVKDDSTIVVENLTNKWI